MGRFDATKATIDANIKSNGNQEITGDILNSVMKGMVDATDAELTQLSVVTAALATLQNEVIANEEVTAAALVSLDERVNALSENVAGEAAVAAINATIVENEEITAAALVDLNTRLAALEAAIANL